MKKLYVFLVVFPLVQLFGQTVGRDGYLVLPVEFETYQKESFMNNIYSGTFDLSNLTFKTQRAWVVYSDRSGNQTYDRPSSNGLKKDVLDFMEPLRVKEIQGAFLHVFKKSFVINDEVKRDIDVGWIHVSNLVVSSFSLLNEKSAPKKAMALISLTDQIDSESLSKEISKSYPIYFDPNQQRRKSNAQKFHINYILKSTSRTILVSKSDKLSSNAEMVESQVEGWMSRLHLTMWDHRICLEPSTTSEAVSAYDGLTIPVFPTLKQINQVSKLNIKLQEGAIRKFNLSDKLPPANLMRMPILDNKPSEDTRIKRVATVGRIGELTPNGRTEIETSALQDELNQLLDKQRSINIVFAIDATKSMTDYYASIALSINEIIADRKNLGLDEVNSLSLRFGVILYRDYPDGQKAVEVMPMTSNISSVQNWLNNVQCESQDTDLPEALYNGLITGLPKVGLNKNQSNVLVLIGDAGNHYPDPKGASIEKIYKIINDYNMSLIGFQVINGKADAYADFNSDIRSLLRKISKESIAGKTGYTGDLVVAGKPNTYKLSYQLKGSDISNVNRFGRFTYANINDPMKTSILKENIHDAISVYMSSVNKRIIDVRSFLEDGAQNSADVETDIYNEAIIVYICSLMSKQGKMTEIECRDWLESIGEFSFDGFTNLELVENVPAFETVVFISKTEFDQLINTLVQFNIPSSSNEKRIKLQLALIEQAKKMLGDDNNDLIQEKTLNEIWDIVLNIPFDPQQKYHALGQTKLKDLSTNKVKAKDIDNFINEFSQKINSFRPDNYRNRSFTLGGQRYYWIPLKDFPGS